MLMSVLITCALGQQGQLAQSIVHCRMQAPAAAKRACGVRALMRAVISSEDEEEEVVEKASPARQASELPADSSSEEELLSARVRCAGALPAWGC